MKFDYEEKVTYLHCIEVDTEDEELFEEVAEEIYEEMCAGCDDGTVDVLWQNWKDDKSLLFYADIDNEIRKVIAWQPLPEPYKPKEAPIAGHIINRFMKVE